MNPSEIVREAIAYTEIYLEQKTRPGTRISERHRIRREFPHKLLAILKDEVY